jgi:glycosyltransferase involved in cell wall biosynthesis
MLDEHLMGAEIVYGIRRQRKSDSWFKRASAESFYRLLRMLGVETIYNHADYRLLSRRALDALRDFREVNLYLRGIIPLIGFKSAVVSYERSVRFAGESKYPIRKMLALALNAITSLSTVPLRLISFMGIFVSVLSVILSIWALIVSVFTDQAVAGWASTVLPMYFLGGIQLLSLGVIGEYIGRIYLECKQRPRYIIDAIIGEVSPD